MQNMGKWREWRLQPIFYFRFKVTVFQKVKESKGCSVTILSRYFDSFVTKRTFLSLCDLKKIVQKTGQDISDRRIAGRPILTTLKLVLFYFFPFFFIKISFNDQNYLN